MTLEGILQRVRQLATHVRTHEQGWLVVILLIGVVFRGLLVAFSPTSFGYVWDFYQDGVRILWTSGHLPASTDCWQCYHPPLFYVLGLPLYALGRLIAGDSPSPDASGLRWLAGVALVSAAVTIYYGYRLLRLFRCSGASLVVGVGLLASLPVLFISSYGAEADIVLTAILSAFIYYFTRDFAEPGRVFATVRLGLLAGLGAATKYSGLAAVVSATIFFAIRIATGPRRVLAIRNAAILIALCAVVGGWKYLENCRSHGTIFYANGSAQAGFSLTGGRVVRNHYEFTTVRLTELLHVYDPHTVRGSLTELPVYRSVFTTLHALTWTDMSFFSDPERHGDPTHPYHRKEIPSALIAAVLVLGFVPELLAAIGFIITVRRPTFLPLAIMCGVGIAAYAWWFVSQESWALKSKYLLFLVSPVVVYAVSGLTFLWNRAPLAGAVAAALMAALIVATNLYVLAFAVR